MSPTHSFGRCALLIAHPGHEIRVHGWMEQVRPTVYVLTDGSGRSGCSRLASTSRIMARAGASCGSIFGRIADRSLYNAVLQQDFGLFHGLVAELAQEIVQQQFDFVLGDAAAGSILTHDLWRGVIDAAVDIAEGQLGRQILNHQFALEGPTAFGASDDPDAWHLCLDDAAFSRKMIAARGYAELRSQVESTLAVYGEDAFRLESLRPVQCQASANWHDVPPYERHGEALVAAGIYPQTVRYRRHVVPLLAALRSRPRAA